MAGILRPYQVGAVADLEHAIAAGERRIILVAPTASGKTIIACELIRVLADRFPSALVLSHRLEIIKQTSRKLHACGIEHGIIKAGFTPRPMERVQVASVATLWVRAMRTKTMTLPPAQLIIVDEAHHTPARTYQKLIEAYPDAIVIGLTATPCRGDGRGLGGIFKVMIECPQVPDLIAQGYLVRSRVYAPVTPNLRGVRIRAGDYVEEQLAGRMDDAKLIGDIVTHWHKFGERRRTIAFAVNVSHSLHLRNEFVKSGVRAEHLDGETPEDERNAILERLASGETEVVCNCMVLTEGFDLPDIGCITLARPTKKMGLFRQMIGRGLRPTDGKKDCIILDHSGAVFEHGFPEDRVEWPLAPDRKAKSPAHTTRVARKTKLVECSQCSAIRLPGEPCPHCGFLPQRPARDVFVGEGELGLVSNGRARATPNDPETKRRWHAMFKHIAAERGYKPGWVAHKYREKFGAFPSWHANPAPIPPSPEVRSWVRSRAIAYAKRPTP